MKEETLTNLSKQLIMIVTEKIRELENKKF